MKFRVVIPDQDMQPLPGESPADAIHRAVVGRVLREVPVGPEITDEDDSSQGLASDSGLHNVSAERSNLV